MTNIIAKTHDRTLHYFMKISEIPRRSGQEEAIAAYLCSWAEERGMKWRRTSDIINGKQTANVVIFKAATKGFEAENTVILQAHMDMVCQKTKDSQHDFEKDPLRIIIDQEKGLMSAEGTTLGADNGIGVAFILAILESEQISHPAINALFTSDEENGMSGAMAISEEFLEGTKGKYLINIDSGEEGSLCVGCAGGIDAVFRLPLVYEITNEEMSLIRFEISGLIGGHSGTAIHKKRANAHKLAARLMQMIFLACKEARLVDFIGGDKQNVITKEAAFTVACLPKRAGEIIGIASEAKAIFAHEYAGIEPSLKLIATQTDSTVTQVLSQECRDQFMRALLLIPNDVQAMHGQMAGMVETSCNLGIVRIEASHIYFVSFIRSFLRSKKLFVAAQMRSLAELIGASFSLENDLPGWEPQMDSKLLARFELAYNEAFGSLPQVKSVHAGLECGYFSEKFPTMAMISCGPNISGAHSPDETLDIKSTVRVMELLIRVLAMR
ncbi:MAG: beta-Ala-His dipeptidase [Lachnospiraceae bacterium]|jgi:dipeptidase D|nr:beta-Ala-His dipeptidase [Lachnospiraceae bacterium]